MKAFGASFVSLEVFEIALFLNECAKAFIFMKLILVISITFLVITSHGEGVSS